MFSPSLPFLATLRGREKNTMRCSKFLAIAFILLDVSASAYAACVGASCKPLITGDTKNWKYDYAHSDEFDAAGESRVDGGKKWSQELGAWTGTAPGFFKKENAVITSNKLVLYTKEVLGPVPRKGGCARGNFAGSFSTPLVVSSDTLSFGFYEIRAKMAKTKASLMSSFFLQSTTGGGEISILDTVPASTKTGLKVSNSYHCFNPADGTTTKSSPKNIANLDPSDGFHTYGVERGTDGSVKFYIDGALTRTLTPTDASCLKQPMKVVFSMVIDNAEDVSGGVVAAPGWGGYPNPQAGFGQVKNEIEYFRHWTHLAPAAPAVLWVPRVAKDDGKLTWAQAQGICKTNSRELCAMSEVCPKGAGSAMVGLALGKYGWFPAADDSAKKNNWVFGVGGKGPAVPSCALHHKTPQYMNQWPAWGTVGGWPDDTSIPCCKSVKKVAAPEVCKDSPITIFTSQSKWTCAQYEYYQWCKGGVIEQGWTETQKIRFNAEEAVKNCCACGKSGQAKKSGELQAGSQGGGNSTAAAIVSTTTSNDTNLSVAVAVLATLLVVAMLYFAVLYSRTNNGGAAANTPPQGPEAFASMPIPASSYSAAADRTGPLKTVSSMSIRKLNTQTQYANGPEKVFSAMSVTEV